MLDFSKGHYHEIQSSTCCGNVLLILDGKIYYNETLLPDLPDKSKPTSQIFINGKIYVNKYKWDFKNKKWKFSLKLLFHNIF